MSKREGKFWIAGGPKVYGTLELGPDSFRLDLCDFCFVPQHFDMTVSGRIAAREDPRSIAADHAPRTILGELEDRQQITFLNARMDTEFFPLTGILQRFTGRQCLSGAHISGPEHIIHGIRWTMNLPYNQAGWLQENTRALTGDAALQGELNSWVHENQPGLQFQPSGPLALNDLRQSVVTALQQLAVLWTGCSVGISRVEIQLDDSHWYHVSMHSGDNPQFVSSRLLPLSELSLGTFAEWMPLSAKLNPLPYIASTNAGVLQVDAQAVVTALEGLHRRLYVDSRPLGKLSKGAVNRAMSAARKAGVEELQRSGLADEELATRLLRENLNHVDQPSYQQRLEELAEDLKNVAPGLFGPDPLQWVQIAKNIRNDQSHQLLDRFYEAEVSQYLIASISGRWMLKLRILLELVDPDRLKSTLHESQTFAFALANMDNEHYWDDFSCLETFRSSQRTH